MNELLLIAGLLVASLAMLDALWTTLWVDGGAAPVARATMRATRAPFARLAGRSRPRLRSVSGPTMLLATVVVWVLLLWTGWTLAFLADDASIRRTSDGALPSLMDVAYFVGYTIFTLGNGDFAPQGALWQALTTLASGTGLFLVTLAITYLLSVLSALTAQRSVANLVLGVADEPAQLVRAWRGDGTWGGFHTSALSIASSLGQTTERHLAYPVLHFLSGARPEKNPGVAVAVLEEAVIILRHGLMSDDQPKGFPLDALESAVTTYLETMGRSMDLRADDVPPAPLLAPLRDAGAPVVDQAVFEARLEPLADRRRRTLGLVRSDGWGWPPSP